jgi:uncharacterized protein (UPF0212 family)
MDSKTIECPHCKKKIDVELMVHNIKKIELGIGMNVIKPGAGKGKPKKKGK